jgi:hypothetical protein
VCSMQYTEQLTDPDRFSSPDGRLPGLHVSPDPERAEKGREEVEDRIALCVALRATA